MRVLDRGFETFVEHDDCMFYVTIHISPVNAEFVDETLANDSQAMIVLVNRQGRDDLIGVVAQLRGERPILVYGT